MKTNDRRIVWCEYDKRLCTIEGIAITARVNSNDQSFNPMGCELSVPTPVLFNHDQQLGAIGEVVLMKKSETEVVVRATIHPDVAGFACWQLIKAGELTGLSVGLAFGRGQFEILEQGGIDYFTAYRLAEVSLCLDPANKDCRFRIYPGGGQKMAHPGIVKAREMLARSEAREARDRPTPTRRRDARPLTGEDDPRLARMHPDSRRLLLELRRKKGV